MNSDAEFSSVKLNTNKCRKVLLYIYIYAYICIYIYITNMYYKYTL